MQFNLLVKATMLLSISGKPWCLVPNLLINRRKYSHSCLLQYQKADNAKISIF